MSDLAGPLEESRELDLPSTLRKARDELRTAQTLSILAGDKARSVGQTEVEAVLAEARQHMRLAGEKLTAARLEIA